MNKYRIFNGKFVIEYYGLNLLFYLFYYTLVDL